MINCIVIDDEPYALEIIKSFCEEIPFLNLAQTFTQVSMAQNFLAEYPVDLVFLDIQMPDMDGITFSKKIKQEVMVIFTTAFSEYAVEGFNVNAIDYLLKPIALDRFQLACNKAKEYLEYTQQHTSDHQNGLYVRSEYALVKILYADILYLETMDDYIKIHLVNGKPVLTLMSMKKMMEKLPQEFVRVHRSYAVSLSKIKSVRAKNITLDGVEIPIGTSYKKSFIALYSGH